MINNFLHIKDNNALKSFFLGGKKGKWRFMLNRSKQRKLLTALGEIKTSVTTIENTLVWFFFQPTRPVNVSEVSVHLNVSGRIPDVICRRELRQWSMKLDCKHPGIAEKMQLVVMVKLQKEGAWFQFSCLYMRKKRILRKSGRLGV